LACKTRPKVLCSEIVDHRDGVLLSFKGDVRRAQKRSKHQKIETLIGHNDNRADMQGEVSNILSGLMNK
jgi:hypothetical protein